MIRNAFMLLIAITFMSCKNNDSPFSRYNEIITPVKLGEGSLSTSGMQWNNVFVSKTKELYYTKSEKTGSVISKFNFKDDVFTDHETLDFPTSSPHSDVFVNSEGNLMLFSSLMPDSETDTIIDWNIWKSVRKEGKWQTPTLFFENNIEGNQFYPWITDSGNIYFSNTPHGSQNGDLYMSEFKNGKYLSPKPLDAINSVKLEGDAFTAPDESFLIFAGFERSQSMGKSDLYISFNNNGTWTSPVWLGEKINSEGYDGSPFVTHDGNYLIFTSSRESIDESTFFNHYIIPFNSEDYR